MKEALIAECRCRKPRERKNQQLSVQISIRMPLRKSCCSNDGEPRCGWPCYALVHIWRGAGHHVNEAEHWLSQTTQKSQVTAPSPINWSYYSPFFTRRCRCQGSLKVRDHICIPTAFLLPSTPITSINKSPTESLDPNWMSFHTIIFLLVHCIKFTKNYRS